MSASRVLIHLLGEIALLLWGIHIISGSVQRAFGPGLRRALTAGLRSRWRAFLAGLGVTALLQSSTATALMVTSFAASGVVDLAPALAVMLGANVGTTLIVQLVSFDVTLIYPLLLLAGVVLNRRGRGAAARDVGSALVGLGLVLLALHLLIETLRPVESAAALSALLRAITDEPLLNVVLAALFSWAAHSSVAAVLFVMSLAGAGVLTPEAALAMVLGANVGSALNPLIASLSADDPAQRRVPVGNLLTRLAGCALFLPILEPVAGLIGRLDPSPTRAAADFHVLFNLAIAVVFLPLVPLLARGLVWLLPDRVRAADPGRPQYLDEAALDTPAVALSNAAREVLRMVDVVEAMLRGVQDAFHHQDRDKLAQISRMDDVLDRLFGAIQRYLGAIGRETLSEAEALRAADTLALAINLEHIGDIIDKNLVELAEKRMLRQLTLPPETLAAIDEMHGRLIDHLQLAVTVFMFADTHAARRLVSEKEAFRQVERATTQRHADHIRAGAAAEIETSALHLDITRDLKRIEAHIAATAYGLLESSGQLRTSRLAT